MPNTTPPLNERQCARFNPEKPFSVGTETFDTIHEAIQIAGTQSLTAECNFRAQVCQPLTEGVFGYAGTSVVIATFRNGIDLDSLAADEDGVPDLDRREGAFVVKVSKSEGLKRRPSPRAGR